MTHLRLASAWAMIVSSAGFLFIGGFLFGCAPSSTNQSNVKRPASEIPPGEYAGESTQREEATDQETAKPLYASGPFPPASQTVLIDNNGVPLEEGRPLAPGVVLKRKGFLNDRAKIEMLLIRKGEIEANYVGEIQFTAGYGMTAKSPVSGQILYRFEPPDQLTVIETVRYETWCRGCTGESVSCDHVRRIEFAGRLK